MKTTRSRVSGFGSAGAASTGLNPKPATRNPKRVCCFRLSSVRGPLGKLVWQAAFSSRGLCSLTAISRRRQEQTAEADARVARLQRVLSARLNGEHVDLAWEEFDLSGAPDFHLRVWKAMRKIPFGQVATYSEIAAAAGSPLAHRACGQACGANRILVFIPCHRVVAANGLGGFGCGLEMKKLLLASERK